MASIAYIIPGYQENYKSRRAYELIAREFKSAGIKPMQVSIKWDFKKPIDFEFYNKQFLKQYKHSKSDKVYILGFSFGALMAFLTEFKTKPDAIILCSLSPYFKENYHNVKPRWLKWWKTNFTNELEFKNLAKKFSTKTYLLAGDREDDSVLKLLYQAKRKIKNSHSVVANGAAHNINNHAYLKAIKEIIGNLPS
jgi:hypothetical protein